MSHYFYITPQEYAEAEMNGIDAFNLERRVHLLGWTKEEAKTKPLRVQNDRKKWAEVAKANGIKYATFMSRITIYGMTEEEAATKPLQNKKDAVKKMADTKRMIPKEWLEVAISNGINYHTFRARLKKGMDPHEAATKKLMTRSEIGHLGAKCYKAW